MKLARKFHSDLYPSDKEAEAKFKDISAANDLLLNYVPLGLVGYYIGLQSSVAQFR